MRTILTDIALNIIDQGPKTAMPLVFIHGFPFSHRMWEPQIDYFAHDYWVISYDIRGHGQSEVGDGQYTVEFFVDDLFAILDHLAVGPCLLCGLSMGGYIALRAMEREPGRLKALVLCDTRADADGNEAKIRRAEAMRTIKTQGIEKYANEFVKLLLAPTTLSSQPKLVEKIKNIIRANPPVGIRGALLALAARTDTTGVLARITVPTLVLIGEHDGLTPPALGEAMRQKIPNAILEVVPKAGHLSNMENPEFFNQKLACFIRNLN